MMTDSVNEDATLTVTDGQNDATSYDSKWGFR